MIVPRVNDVSISEKSCNSIVESPAGEHTKSRPIKRKLFDDDDDDDGSVCDSVRTAKLEVIVVNGKWHDEGHIIPSIVGDMRNVSFDDVESVSWANYNGRHPAAAAAAADTHFDCFSLPLDESSSSSNSRHLPDNDNEASNLSWLLNFKVDSLFNTSAGVHERGSYADDDASRDGAVETRFDVDVSKGFLSETKDNVEKSQSQPSRVKLFKPSRYIWAKKPPFTYTELIEQALREKGELTVSGIYNWISEHFPFYKANDDRWKNSVRHNLSINPHFRKGSKAPHGAGHLWTVAHKDAQSRYSMRKQQRIHQFMSNLVTPDELEAATANIEENKENRVIPEEVDPQDNSQQEETYVPEVFSPSQGVSLEQSAEEILSGVKKEVQVQYLIPIQEKTAHKTDFLNPVSKDVIVQESGLLDRDGDLEGSYLITDLNPIALDLNMADTEIVTADDNLFTDEIGFQYYEFTSQSPQVQV